MVGWRMAGVMKLRRDEMITSVVWCHVMNAHQQTGKQKLKARHQASIIFMIVFIFADHHAIVQKAVVSCKL